MATMDLASHKLYWLTNMMLAGALARKYGLHEAGAIKRCARRLRDSTRSADLHELAQLVLKARDESIVNVINGLFEEKTNV